jgi:hypothetical protein
VLDLSVLANRLPRHRSKRLALRVTAVSVAVAATLPVMALPASAAFPGFTAGDLVIYRVGTGGSAPTSASTAVTLDEYTTAAAQSAPVTSLPMPVTTGTGITPNPLTASGSATSEGGLTLAADGSALLVPGYDAAPGVSGIASTSAAAGASPQVEREVAEVDAAGDINDTTTDGTTAFSGNNPRSAAAQTSGAGIWLSGAGTTTSEAVNGGVWYTTQGSSSSTQVIGGNWRWSDIYAGQLYTSSGSATAPAVIGVNAIGTGLPTTSASTTVLSGVDSSSSGTPYNYLLINESGANGSGPDTAYVADSSTGIEKYSYISGAWTAEGSVPVPASVACSPGGYSGLTGTVSGGTVDLYFTDPCNLFSLSDPVGTGSISGATPTVLASAASNEWFRGVAFAPGSVLPPVSTPEVPYLIALPLLALGVFGGSATWVIARRRRRIAA